MFQQDQEIFNILLDAASEGVVIVDSNQMIVEVNKSAEIMFGYAPRELLGQPLNKLIPKKNQSDHHNHFKEFMIKQEHRQMGHGRDIFGVKKNGEIFPLEAGLNPFKIYGKSFVMAVVIDITIRKEQERKIQELNFNLERKVSERSKDLNNSIIKLKNLNEELSTEINKRKRAEKEMLDALNKEKELNELKTKFLSLVSHEFRTPLSGILTSALLLAKYTNGDQQEKRNKHISTITQKVNYLNKILSDFLSIEKLESGKITYRPVTFNLSKVINEVVYNANMLLKEGQHIIYPKQVDQIVMNQDEKIIELILSNVLHNAIKYSKENSIIHIKVKQNGRLTFIFIEDNGIGIPEKDQKNIFNRYFRAENAINIQGTGIGLNIVKSHLNNLNGEISFISSENKGTKFKICVPNNFEEHEKNIVD